MSPDASARADALFADRFGGPPALIAAAPARINLIGEHVDYAEGLVLPAAIDRRIAIAGRTAARGAIRSESHGEAAPGDGWSHYASGPAELLRERGVAVPPLALAIASDVPVGGGLASSAALGVAATLLSAAAARHDIAPEETIAICQESEHRFAGTPCGPMDMTVVLRAAPGHAILIDCRDGATRPVALPEELAFVLVDSGVRHRLSDGGYAARRRDVEDAARRLRLRSLRDADESMLEALDGVVARRARHVVREIGRVRAAVDALASGDLDGLGRLLSESHRSLRDDFEVSVPELDAIVEAAIATRGVLGARMIGGGFGGFALLLVERAHAAAVCGAFAPRAFVARPAGGALLTLCE